MKIAVLVSGGVDSSVALKLLKDAGHDVTAFYLKIWLEDELSSLGNCPWEEDLRYARAVCDQLNVPLNVINLQKEYHERVVAYTVREAHAGRTPNPDVLCNQYIKFGLFFDHIDDSFEKVATGHYARVEYRDGRYRLYRAPDPIKDQTYFLCNLSQNQLSRALFPLGELTKAEVRAHAAQFNLPTKDRKDSQGICFLGKFKFTDFMRHHLGSHQGNIVEFETNKILGTHDGHWFYTIGQRRGIKLSGGPWYVVAKNPDTNTVFVSHRYEEIESPRNSFLVNDLSWIAQTPDTDSKFLVKMRHRSNPRECIITHSPQKTEVTLVDGKDQGIAPGQFAVFYHGNECVGRAIIA